LYVRSIENSDPESAPPPREVAVNDEMALNFLRIREVNLLVNPGP
jgi:hypothetical protein